MSYLWTWRLSVVPWRVTPCFRLADPVHTESWVSGTCSTRPAEKCRPLDHVKRIVYPIHQMIIWSNDPFQRNLSRGSNDWFKSETRPSSLRNLELASIFDLRLQNLLKSFYFNVVRAYWLHDICACTLSKVSLAILKSVSRWFRSRFEYTGLKLAITQPFWHHDNGFKILNLLYKI